MKNKIFILFTLTFVIVSISFSQAGTTGLSFLKIGQGSRAVSMGEAYSVIGSEPYAIYYNPAGLTLSSNTQAVFSHREWIQGTKSEFLGATTHLGDVAIGFGLHSVSVADIELRTNPGPSIGTFDAKNVAIGLALAMDITPEISLGVTGNYLYEKIFIDEASGFGLNFGALYKTPWKVNLGLAVDNVGSMNEFNTTASSLPTTFRFGGAYEFPVESLQGNVIVATEIVSVKDEGKAHLHIGAEYEYQQMFAIRLGYESGYESKDLTTGIGFKYSIFNFDYAFVPVKLDLGSSHTFTLGVSF